MGERGVGIRGITENTRTNNVELAIVSGWGGPISSQAIRDGGWHLCVGDARQYSRNVVRGRKEAPKNAHPLYLLPCLMPG